MAHIANRRTKGMPAHRHVEGQGRNLVALEEVGEKAPARRCHPLGIERQLRLTKKTPAGSGLHPGDIVSAGCGPTGSKTTRPIRSRYCSRK
jgi:hypothetical protein